jgi:hypothetical protein
MNVEGSTHFVFAIDRESVQESSTGQHVDEGANECVVCGLSFASKAALQLHLEAPALPDPSAVDVKTTMTQKPTAGKVGSGDTRPENASDLAQSQISSQANSPVKDLQSNTMNWKVTQAQHGQRLRRFLQHAAFPKLARKPCDNLVIDGMILVNGSVALDRSRILKEGDVVASVTGEGENTSKPSVVGPAPPAEISIVAWHPPLNGDSPGADTDAGSASSCILVVNKPVGVRTRGIYESACTVEQLISQQMNARYESFSSMDTGIGGLCVLRLATMGNILRDVRVQSEFTVLVHGHVPAEWNDGISAEAPIQSIRKWDRKTKKMDFRHGSDATNEPSGPNTSMEDEDAERVRDQPMEDNSCSEHPSWTMRITCMEKTSLKRRQQDGKTAPALSTLQISTTCTASGLCPAIILYLRKHRYPVVGDRLCQREFQALPRSFRNRLKKRLMIGCFSVQVLSLNRIDDGVSSTGRIQGTPAKNESICQEVLFDELSDNKSFRCRLDIPEKFSAEFWQRFFHHQSLTPPEPSLEITAIK